MHPYWASCVDAIRKRVLVAGSGCILLVVALRLAGTTAVSTYRVTFPTLLLLHLTFGCVWGCWRNPQSPVTLLAASLQTPVRGTPGWHAMLCALVMPPGDVPPL